MSADNVTRAAEVIGDHTALSITDPDNDRWGCQCGHDLGAGEGVWPTFQRHNAQALADAGLLARDLPARDEIAEWWRTFDGPAYPTGEEVADALLALLRGEQ